MRLTRIALAAAMAAALVGCTPVTTGLRKQVDAGAWPAAIKDGDGWLKDHGQEPARAEEARQVRLLVAEARLGAIRARPTPEALAAFRADHRDPLYQPLVAQALALEAAVAWRGLGPAATSAALAAFAGRYPGTQEAGQARRLLVARGAAAAEEARAPAAERAFRAEFEGWEEASDAVRASRARELGLAEAAALRARSVAVEERLREAYRGWPDAAEVVGRSRVRELGVAFQAAREPADEAALRAFQDRYAGWPEAATFLDEARRLEAAVALQAAEGDADALRAVAARFREGPWPARVAERLAVVRLAPVVQALETGAAPEDEVVAAFLAAPEPLAAVRPLAQPYAPALLVAADQAGRSSPYRLYLALFPEGPGVLRAAEREQELAFGDAAAAGTAEAWRAVAERFPADARAEEAERRAATLERLAAGARGGPQVLVTGRRVLPGGEVQLTLDVVRCGERVAGLRREAFEVYLGGERQPLTGFLALEEDRPVQIVFALDLSGSMVPEREAVRQAIAQFAETFRFRGRSATIGLVLFGDEVSEGREPTGSVETFKAWLQRPSQTELGAAEDSTGALLVAGDLLARAPAERVVVLLTDEPLQVNLIGQFLLSRRPACDKQGRQASDFIRCRDDGACRMAQLKRLVPSLPWVFDTCVRANSQAICAAVLGDAALGQALAACSGVAVGNVEAGSAALEGAIAALARREVRPFMILPHELAGAPTFGAISRALGGQIYGVDDDSPDPATYDAPLLAIADQLSKQYVVRYRPAAGREAAEPQVLVRLGHDWTTWAAGAGALAALAPRGAGRPGCPELAALAPDGRLLRSADCARRFEAWRPGGVGQAEQLLGVGGAIWLRTGGRIARVDADGALAWPEGAPARAELLVAAADGATWVAGTATDGRPVVARSGAGTAAFAPVELAGLERVPLALLPAGDGGICAVAGPGQLRCRDAAGLPSAPPAQGLDAAATGAAPGEVLAVAGRARTFLWATSAGALVRTTDGGGHFRAVLPAGGSPWRLMALPGPGGLLCAATQRAVRCSEDTGLSWFQVGTDLAQDQQGGAISASGGQVFLERGGQLARLSRVVNRDVPSSAVYFGTDSDEPSRAMAPFLAQIGRTLAADPRLVLRVEGHADQRGGDDHNDGLARRRAEAVARQVVASGAGAGQVEVASFGARRPVRSGGGPEDLARNRRVELLLMQPLAFEGGEPQPCPVAAGLGEAGAGP